MRDPCLKEPCTPTYGRREVAVPPLREGNLCSFSHGLRDMSPLSRLTNLEAIKDVPQLCELLQCRAEDIQHIILHPEEHYTHHIVARRRGSQRPRHVYSGDALTRRLHQRVAMLVSPASDDLPVYVQGFRRGGSVFGNAKLHCGKPFVVTADLRDFFDNIGTQRVAHTFEKLGAERRSALILARLCTRHGSLPQGGRASPVLSNLCVSDLDSALFHFAETRSLTYSRYADDIAFSGASSVTHVELRHLVSTFGFDIRGDSYRCQESQKGQFVTGLNVTGSNPRIPRKVRRKLEAAIRFGSKHGLTAHLKRFAPHSSGRPDKYLRHLYGLAAAYRPVETEACDDWVIKLSRISLTSTDSSE